MTTHIPYINTIRFWKDTIDYETTFPQFDLETQGVEYQRGVTPVSVTPDYLVNKEISIEIYTDETIDITKDAIIYLPDSSIDVMTVENITNSLWVSEPVYLIKYTPTQEGIHQIELRIGGVSYFSDPFRVKSASELKDLIQIQFYDSENRYQGYFYDGVDDDEYKWQPYAYYTGIKRPIAPATEQSTYIDEPGNTLVLETTSSRDMQLTLTDIHSHYIDVINQQRKCDNFFVNGVQYSCTELTAEPIEENSDVVNIILTLTETNNDGFFNH